jgi:hypothetical protein
MYSDKFYVCLLEVFFIEVTKINFLPITWILLQTRSVSENNCA